MRSIKELMLKFIKYRVIPVLLLGFTASVHAGEMDGRGLVCNKQGGYGKTHLSPIYFERGMVKDVIIEELSIKKSLVGNYESANLRTVWIVLSENGELSERVFDWETGRLGINEYLTDISKKIYTEWECELTDWERIEIYMRKKIEKLMQEMRESKH